MSSGAYTVPFRPPRFVFDAGDLERERDLLLDLDLGLDLEGGLGLVPVFVLTLPELGPADLDFLLARGTS